MLDSACPCEGVRSRNIGKQFVGLRKPTLHNRTNDFVRNAIGNSTPLRKTSDVLAAWRAVHSDLGKDIGIVTAPAKRLDCFIRVQLFFLPQFRRKPSACESLSQAVQPAAVEDAGTRIRDPGSRPDAVRVIERCITNASVSRSRKTLRSGVCSSKFRMALAPDIPFFKVVHCSILGTRETPGESRKAGRPTS